MIGTVGDTRVAASRASLLPEAPFPIRDVGDFLGAYLITPWMATHCTGYICHVSGFVSYYADFRIWVIVVCSNQSG